MTIGAVVLADGAEIDGRPAALLELGSVPLVVRLLVALSGAGVDEVGVVVGGEAAAAVESAVQAFPITLVMNPGSGEAAALRTALPALSPRLDALIVASAAQPLIDAADVVALIGAYKKRGAASMVVPRVAAADGRSDDGTPLIFDAALRDDADLAAGDLRGWRGRNAGRIGAFTTDNRRYVHTIASPADVERFSARSGHGLAWPRAQQQPQPAR